MEAKTDVTDIRKRYVHTFGGVCAGEERFAGFRHRARSTPSSKPVAEDPLPGGIKGNSVAGELETLGRRLCWTWEVSMCIGVYVYYMDIRFARWASTTQCSCAFLYSCLLGARASKHRLLNFFRQYTE